MLGTREYTLCSPFMTNAHNSSFTCGQTCVTCGQTEAPTSNPTNSKATTRRETVLHIQNLGIFNYQIQSFLHNIYIYKNTKLPQIRP